MKKWRVKLNMSRRFELVSTAPADTKLPTRKTKGSAGYDFFLPCDVVLQPYSTSGLIPTGVKAKMGSNDVLMLYIRSSVGIKKNVTLANDVGIIDSDYYNNKNNEGNIGLVLRNNSGKTVRFSKGERVMQGIFTKFYLTEDDKADGKRKGGTGSTGKD